MRSHLLFAFLTPLASAIWPLPSTYTNGSSVLWLDNDVVITYQSPVGSLVKFNIQSPDTSDQSPLVSAKVVQTAIRRTYNTIFKQNFVPWMLNPRDSTYEPTESSSSQYIKSVALIQTAADPAGLTKSAALNESYTLDVTAAGVVTITAPSSIGLSYGLTTFSQLFYAHSNGTVYTKLAPVHIADTPMFSHRGLNMDVARSYFPVSYIKKQIDGLAFNKLNRLHIHITDSQSWPLDIPSMPELAAKGGYTPSLIYTAANLRGIQHYGALLGVEVFIEIDMPGHIGSIHYAYPDLITAANVQPDWNTYSAEPPSGQFRLNSTAVYDFLGKLWKDLLPRLTPYTTYMHTGGDEFNLNAYLLDPTVNSNSMTVIRPLLQKFIDAAHAQIRAAGLTPIVWEEMLLDYGITLGDDVVVQAWLSAASVLATVQRGHKVVAGAYELWYLDCGQGQWVDSLPGAVAEANYPYTDYCAPRHSWRLIYSYDPLNSIPANLTHLVLGGEASLWTEQIDMQNADRMLWPRMSAVAEVLWSGAKDAAGNNRSQVTAAPRLSDMRERLVARGIQSEPVYMPFCTQGHEQCVNWY